MPSDPQDQLIDAIHDDRLADLDHPVARATCETIGSRMATEIERAAATLERAGIEVPIPAPPVRLQRHATEFQVPDAATARRAARALGADGFEIWEPLSGGAGRIQARFHNVVTVARTTDVTIALRLRWPDRGPKIPRGLVPNQADFGFVDVPAPLWPLYFAVRPLRLAVERAGLRPAAPPVLGPFLSTPDDLVPALLDVAAVTSTDTVADLGCGDGRILIEAARRTGCRALGVETDPSLVKRADQRATIAGVSDLVRIVHGDAGSVDLTDTSVVFVFLPADATVDLVDALLGRLTPGTRIVAHEQHRLPRQIPGATSTPLVRGQGVTVAHQWIVAR